MTACKCKWKVNIHHGKIGMAGCGKNRPPLVYNPEMKKCPYCGGDIIIEDSTPVALTHLHEKALQMFEKASRFHTKAQKMCDEITQDRLVMAEDLYTILNDKLLDEHGQGFVITELSDQGTNVLLDENGSLTVDIDDDSYTTMEELFEEGGLGDSFVFLRHVLRGDEWVLEWDDLDLDITVQKNLYEPTCEFTIKFEDMLSGLPVFVHKKADNVRKYKDMFD